jgi:hypothetical protein
MIKRTKKMIERQTQIVAEICQNRTADKDRFFRGFSIAQIKRCKTNRSLEITWACAQEIADQKDILRIFTNFYGAAQKFVSGCYRLMAPEKRLLACG